MNGDRLDEAIDQVAARLTRVDDENALTVERIIAALPQRRPLFWILQGWAPGLAAVILAVTTALMVLEPFNDGSTDVLRTENASAPIVELARAVTEEAPGTPAVEPLENLRRAVGEPTEPPVDHERSLVALAAPEALSIGALTPDDLPAEDALAIAPLAIADLPLTAEFSQR